MSKYRSIEYWNSQLELGTASWKTSEIHHLTAANTFFLHTAVMNYRSGLLDFDWACYPDVKGLLGFLQFVYLPSAFRHWLNPDEESLQIPLCSQAKLLAYLNEFPISQQSKMESDLRELESYWELDDRKCKEKLILFIDNFNRTWSTKELALTLHFFNNTSEIAEYLIRLNPFSEILEEDWGMTELELRQLCKDFYSNQMIQKNFLSLLQNRIGCIA